MQGEDGSQTSSVPRLLAKRMVTAFVTSLGQCLPTRLTFPLALQPTTYQ